MRSYHIKVTNRSGQVLYVSDTTSGNLGFIAKIRMYAMCFPSAAAAHAAIKQFYSPVYGTKFEVI